MTAPTTGQGDPRLRGSPPSAVLAGAEGRSSPDHVRVLDRVDEATLRALAHLVGSNNGGMPGVVGEVADPLRSA